MVRGSDCPLLEIGAGKRGGEHGVVLESCGVDALLLSTSWSLLNLVDQVGRLGVGDELFRLLDRLTMDVDWRSPEVRCLARLPGKSV